jgi:hypothetical protein
MMKQQAVGGDHPAIVSGRILLPGPPMTLLHGASSLTGRGGRSGGGELHHARCSAPVGVRTELTNMRQRLAIVFGDAGDQPAVAILQPIIGLRRPSGGQRTGK